MLNLHFPRSSRTEIVAAFRGNLTTLVLAWVGLIAIAPELNAGLVAHFRLEEGSATTVSSEVNGWTGDFAGAVLGTSPNWETTDLAPVPDGTVAAVHFDSTLTTGADPHILTTFPGVTGTAPRTVACWIKASPTQPNNAVIVGYGANQTARRYSFRINSAAGADFGKIRLEVQGHAAVGTNTVVADGTWHHVAVVSQANTTAHDCTLYVDGAPQGKTFFGTAATIDTLVDTPTLNLTLGNSPHSLGTYGFNGSIDDVRVYDEALSQRQIQELIFGSGNPPAITTQPLNQKPVLGDPTGSVTLKVAVSGSPPLAYQWHRAGTPIPGATNFDLNIAPVTAADLGDYQVIVTNSLGSVTSVVAMVVWGTAPIEPVRQVGLPGGSATFRVQMPPARTYTYQWQQAGVDIPGATGATYTRFGLTDADSADYTVRVTLGAETATSDPARLLVLPPPTSAYPRFVLEDSPAAYWRLGESDGANVASDETTFHPGGFTNYATGQLGVPGAVPGDGNTASDFSVTQLNYVEVPFSAQLNPTEAFTLEAWARPNATGGRRSLIASHSSLPSDGYELALNDTTWQFRTGASLNPSTQVWDDLNGGTVTLDAWHHVVATFENGSKRLYINGELVGTQTVTLLPSPGTVMRLGAGATHSPNAANFFGGAIDEVAIYRRVLTTDQILDHYRMGAIGLGVAPTISAQPEDQTVILGDTNDVATFTVAADGSPRLRYQWTKDGVDVPGANASTLLVRQAGLVSPGSYSVTVTNDAGSATSLPATLSMVAAPILPGSQTVVVGARVVFSIDMPPHAGTIYQWRRNGTDLPGATSATLDLGNVSAGDADGYSVLVTLGSATVESDPVTLTVLPLPTQGYAGVVAAAAPSFWWRLGESPGTTVAADASGGGAHGTYFSDVWLGEEGALPGDHDTAARFTGYTEGNRGPNSKMEVPFDPFLFTEFFTIECWARVMGGAGRQRSVVTAWDTAASVANKGFAIFAGDNDRWQFWLGDGTTNWVIQTGPPVVENDWVHLVGSYDGSTMRFFVNGTLVGSLSTLYLPNDNPANPLRIGAGATENAGGNYFFVGLIDEVAIYGETLTLQAIQNHYAAAFQPSAMARFNQQPHSRAVMAGSPLTFSAKVHGAPPISYQWQRNGVDLPGQTAATLTLPAAAAGDAGTYRLIATNPGGLANSAEATLDVLPGRVISVSLRGFENSRLIGANGGVAGYVRAANWNEIGYNAASGTFGGLADDLGQLHDITATWQASSSRRWNGPYLDPAGDFALMNGSLESGANNVTIVITNLPPAYQSAGYTLYVYLSAPYAASGVVAATNWFGAVQAAGTTYYWHSLDLALWNGDYIQTLDTVGTAPGDANLAVFSGLTAPGLTLIAQPHPLLPGPAAVSGFQIVANVVTTAPDIRIRREGNDVIVSWDGDAVLQSKPAPDTSAGDWTDIVTGSPYLVPTPLLDGQFFRLRSR